MGKYYNYAVQSVRDRERKLSRNAAGICYLCGVNPVEDGKKSCKACRKKRSDYNKMYKKKHPEKFVYGRTISEEEAAVFEDWKPSKKPKYTLDEMCRMAKERGISYGKLVTELEMAR